jgi:glutathione S-transferase
MREDPAVKLLQIPFSHNSIKVRRVLALKGLEYERKDINPAIRRKLKRLSAQELAPVLVDGSRVVADSTAIVLYLEEAYPDPPLLPAEKPERSECLVLEDWADTAFMELTRRIAYWTMLSSGVSLGDLFFPRYPKPFRQIGSRFAATVIRRRFGLSAKQAEEDEVEARRVAKLAVDRLAGRPFLVGDRITLADVALASMSAPLQLTPGIRDDPSVAELLEWDRTILEDEFTPPQVRAVTPAEVLPNAA